MFLLVIARVVRALALAVLMAHNTIINANSKCYDSDINYQKTIKEWEEKN